MTRTPDTYDLAGPARPRQSANCQPVNRPSGGLRIDDYGQRLSKLETGKVPNPTVSTLRALARALNKRLSWSLIDEPAGVGR